jgi:outer membrane lipoprotein
MKTLFQWVVLSLLILLLGCAVISRPIMNDAVTGVDFTHLAASTDAYQGKTVILGGHVVEVRNEARQTVLVILQTPLGYGQEPLPPDKSQGRFMLKQEGFLDPEVYARGRTVTTAGRVIGITREAIDHEPYDYVVLEAREIYLWERMEDLYRYHPYYRSPAYSPYYRRPWRRYPY